MNPRTAEDVRAEMYGKRFACARCASSVDCIFNEDHDVLLTALGWHRAADGARLCSKTCLEWHAVLSKNAAPLVSVGELPDAIYQQRRSKAYPVPAPTPRAAAAPAPGKR